MPGGPPRSAPPGSKVRSVEPEPASPTPEGLEESGSRPMRLGARVEAVTWTWLGLKVMVKPNPAMPLAAGTSSMTTSAVVVAPTVAGTVMQLSMDPRVLNPGEVGIGPRAEVEKISWLTAEVPPTPLVTPVILSGAEALAE